MLKIMPNTFDEVLNHHLSGQLHLAKQGYQALIEQGVELYSSLSNLAVIYDAEKNYTLASELFEKALKQDPHNPTAHYNLGKSFKTLGDLKHAQGHLEDAIKINPNFVDALYTLGEVYKEQNKLQQSIHCYEKALALNPHFGYALVQYWFQKQSLCDWQNQDKLTAQIQGQLQAQSHNPQLLMMSPFLLVTMLDEPQWQLTAAQQYSQAKTKKTQAIQPKRPTQSSNGKIRIGYLSSDFHDHATSYLIAELFELHDKDLFDIHLFSYGEVFDKDPLYQRLKDATPFFHEVGHLSDSAISNLIQENNIDIAIDLKGYTKHARSQILSLRPSPIQVSYLGYPGTMGADYIDYLIADGEIIPESLQSYYSEKIAYMPHSYQPNDRKRVIASTIPTRTQCHLPEEAFVFCCFNRPYKFKPETFAIWLDILNETPNSILWLLDGPQALKDNLVQFAKQRGIEANRLIFAPMLPISEHLARLKNADLFLDTYPCNAHTTASDALWAEVPVLTCQGQSFASRVASSLLKACTLDELVTTNLQDYKDKALSLCRDKGALTQLKAKLSTAKEQLPLFNTEQYARDLEALFKTMVDTFNNQVKPTHIQINKAPTATIKSQSIDSAYYDKQAKTLSYLACPICQNKEAKAFSVDKANNKAWQQCLSCSHLYKQTYLNKVAQEAKRNAEEHLKRDIDFARHHIAPLIDKVATIKPNGVWLDLSYQQIDLALTAKEFGYEVKVCHQNQAISDYLTKLGIDIIQSPIEDKIKQVDIISLVQRLEYDPYPINTLLQASQILKTDGLLLINSVNRDSPFWTLSVKNEQNPYLNEAICLHQFGKSQLVDILNQCGFSLKSFSVSKFAPLTLDLIAIKESISPSHHG